MGKWFASIVLVSSVVACAYGSETAPWPQFRGPAGSGVAEGQNPPVEFGPDENVLWKVSAPSGLSSPIIVGDKLVLTALEEGKLYTIAYNRADGGEAWRVHAPASELEPYHKTEGGPASSTPATDGERIVSYFGSCGLFCYDLTGKELWKYEMPPAATIGNFGTGVSPVIADGAVILVRDEIKDPKIVVLDAISGKPMWEKKRMSNSSFSTPAVWKTTAGTQIAMPGFGRMIGYDLKTGDEAWFVNGMPSACCTTPVTHEGNLYFAGWSPGDPNEKESQMPSFDDLLKAGDADKDGVLSKAEAENGPMKGFFDSIDSDKDGSYTREESDAMKEFMEATVNSAFALKPGGTGDVGPTHTLWRQTKGLPYVPSAIVYQGQYVMVKDGGIVTAFDATTGDKLYEKRSAESGSYYASPVAAGGNIYLTSLSNGTVTVLRAGAAEPEVVATNAPLDERVAATPAIADDAIYIRTAGYLYAFGEK